MTVRIVRELHENADRTFYVFLAKGEDGEEFKFSTTHPATRPKAKEQVLLQGKWGTYKGQKTFRAAVMTPVLPKGAKGIVGWLRQSSVKGVGHATANKLAEAFGDDLENVVGDAEALAKAIPREKAVAIAEAWASNAGQAELVAWLGRFGLGPLTTKKIIKQFGARSKQIIEENPWVLAETIEGIAFRSADEVAHSAGHKLADPKRIRGALRFFLDTRTREGGHCGLPPSTLVATVADEIGVAAAAVRAELDEVADGRTHALDAVTNLVYPIPLLRDERDIADRILTLMAEAKPAAETREEAARIVDGAAAELGFVLDESQRQAAVAAVSEGICILTGGPGTGKTTTVRVILKALQSVERKVAIAGPTGRSAKRAADVTGAKTSTLHRMLEWEAAAGGFTRNQRRPLQEDHLIVDEFSMVDTRLAAAFFQAVAPGSAITIVGDVDQLPSVGPGQILRDLIASGSVPVCRLSVVHRQKDGNDIVAAAHNINAGALPAVSAAADGFGFTEAYGAGGIADHLVRMVTRDLPERGIDVSRDVQILAGMRQGEIGVTKLNEILKATLNPAAEDGRSARLGHRLFTAGDRVMQMRNNYEKKVFNGEVGQICWVGEVKRGEKDMVPAIRVEYPGDQVVYTAEDADDIDYAWATTVHKSQGCEFPVVLFVMPSSHQSILSRNLLYTAVTRAKQECHLVGDGRVLRSAIAKADTTRRFTGLALRLAAPGPAPVCGETFDEAPAGPAPR
ncbi:ATP-dependent RecD-like DNA helicase [Methylobacterium hispanicum]|uniref:ATP-dependent RecD-like DNA helicase n=1 Tax=Methylobacterium hispanicum TaxID=270350 RepID=A0AAV4ZUM0_9HYPH|nr:AAA family ATPase [Methylobacterium hispanicum]GJD91593.1 ATP-dependent RecD-like DNA helicase [Methylobacterium hispanicum]